MPPHHIKLADEIRSLRERTAESMTALAQRLGVTPQTLCQWERGRRPIPWDRLGEILALFAVDDATMLRMFKLRAGM